MTPEERKLEKLNKMLEMMSNDTITPQELEKFLTLVLGVITSAKDKFDSVSQETLQKVQTMVSQMMSEHSDTTSEMSQEMKDMMAKCDQMCKEMLDKCDKMCAEVEMKEPVVPPLETIAFEASKLVEKTLTPLIPKIEDIEKDLPKLGTEIRDGLELLKGDARLDKNSIRGIEEIEANIKEIKIRPTASVGGRSLLQLYTDGTKRGAVQYINLIAGTNMTITYARSNGRNDITFSASGGAGMTVVAVTGTINDTNTSFTCASTPVLVVINGLAYNGTTGSITWTYVGTTITLSAPIGTGGDIYVLA